MEDMEVKAEKDYILFNISGDIEQEDSTNIRKLLDSYILENQHNFAFHLDSTHFMDSAALTMFVLKSKEVRKVKGWVAFINLTPECLEIFHITRLDQHFNFIENEADLKLLSKGKRNG